jgi:hypothetical protein
MAKPKNYVPRMNDPVHLKWKGVDRYVVVSVDTEKKTADVKPVSGLIVFIRGVPWSDLSLLDKSQNAA